MAIADELGEAVWLRGFEISNLDEEPEPRTWFRVILGAGEFATRAFSESYAFSKAELLAEELLTGKAKINTNGGMPLVMPMSDGEKRVKQKLWFEGRPETELTSLRVANVVSNKQDEQGEQKVKPRTKIDRNQGRLFELPGNGITLPDLSDKI